MVNFNAVEVFLKQFLLFIQAVGVAAADSVAIPAAVSSVDLLDEDWGSGLNSFRMSDWPRKQMAARPTVHNSMKMS